MYKLLDIKYDNNRFLELFRTAKKSLAKKNFIEAVDGDFFTDSETQRILSLFPFIPAFPASVGFTQLRKDLRPYINDGNNGLIIFPIIGKLDFRFYNYQAPVVNGRPVLSPIQGATPEELLTDIEQNHLSETVIVESGGIVINGQVPHSYHIYNNQLPLLLMLKIPLDVEWSTVIESLN